jgi:phosphoribosylformylglycinamidine synthase
MNRLFVEKLPEFNAEARHLLHDLRSNLDLASLESVRVIQRYDVDGLSDELFHQASRLILAEPQVDAVSTDLAIQSDETAFAVEYLPGQFDQRSDSAAQCIQILAGGQRPSIASAHVLILKGLPDADALARVKDYVINSVDSREASMEIPTTLQAEITTPAPVARLEGFGRLDAAGIATLRDSLGLAMSEADLAFCQNYFCDEEKREPTITEIRMLDTYWSDHCRHTTFLAAIEDVTFSDATAPIEEAYKTYLATRDSVYGPDTTRAISLMDIALMGMKELRKSGELDNVEVSEEVNAASIVVPVEIHDPAHPNEPATTEEWLVMFKNETHNHPTEIEPYGGAATCLGGCIRDPLSGRSYVYQAMRVTGAGDPRTPFAETLPGKLPQRKICQIAAKGYSSYGNQIGLATGQVSEIYHPGYVAKRMEVGAVVAAAPRAQVFRGSAEPGDAILLIGGRTGRDGVGGATGSSKEHTETALENSAEVQKGDPPTERKIQRLFRNPELSKKIKVCNDFGAGGISVAIGELAPSLEVDLDKVLKKYDGLDGTELAISESQERMAVVIDASEIDYFIAESDRENLECVHVATVADDGRLRINWKGDEIVSLSRKFLDSNGVQQNARISVNGIPAGESPLNQPLPAVTEADAFTQKVQAVLSDLNTCSQKGLGEMFDASIGAGTVLHPFGGEQQLTPPDAMVAKIPLLTGETDTCTYMSWGYTPRLASWSPFHGAAYAVTESVCRIMATGARLEDIRLTFQEYFEKLGQDPARWGKPFSALLGAFHVQHGLRLAAIGGKDSMSGSFQDLDVPPTLVSFAVAPGKASQAISPEFKAAGHKVSVLSIPRTKDGLPDLAHLKKISSDLHQSISEGVIVSAHTLGEGGLIAGLAKMAFGNMIGFLEAEGDDLNLFQERHACFLIESVGILPACLEATFIGNTCAEPSLSLNEQKPLLLADLLKQWRNPLEEIYPTQAKSSHPEIDSFSHPVTPVRTSIISKVARPKVIIPVFPGNNCEYDTARAFQLAGAETETLIFRNLTPEAVEESLQALEASIRSSQILMIPGGFSAGDEPDGSGKFIATALRNPRVGDAVMDLLKNRDGLILGICNGFQALIKTGLVPYGEIRDPEAGTPTLTFNDIGRHVSCYVTTRVSSTLSPWLSHSYVDDLHTIPVSHGEGKFYASAETVQELAAAGQIATQYADPEGHASMDIAHNPNGSVFGIEGITSPCGRVFGKMAHTERRGLHVAKNIAGEKSQPLFRAGVEYFQG